MITAVSSILRHELLCNEKYMMENSSRIIYSQNRTIIIIFSKKIICFGSLIVRLIVLKKRLDNFQILKLQIAQFCYKIQEISNHHVCAIYKIYTVHLHITCKISAKWSNDGWLFCVMLLRQAIMFPRSCDSERWKFNFLIYTYLHQQDANLIYFFWYNLTIYH